MLLSQAVDLFLGQQTHSTRNSYKYTLFAMRDYVGPARPLEAVAPEHLLEYMQTVRERPGVHSPATINKYVKTIRVFFNWCVKNEFLAKSPAGGVKRVREYKSIPRTKAMPDSTYETLLDYAKWTPRYHALVLFLGDTGCRIGGAAHLRWSDIDLDAHTAMVEEKGKPPRPVFFGEECAQALRRWQTQHTGPRSSFVFQQEGKLMRNDSLGHLFERLCHRAGIGQWGPHSLRHRKGHQLADHRIAPTVAAKALGHENPTITLNYYYPDDWERVRQAVEGLTHDARSDGSKIIRLGGKLEDKEVKSEDA